MFACAVAAIPGEGYSEKLGLVEYLVLLQIVQQLARWPGISR